MSTAESCFEFDGGIPAGAVGLGDAAGVFGAFTEELLLAASFFGLPVLEASFGVGLAAAALTFVECCPECWAEVDRAGSIPLAAR